VIFPHNCSARTSTPVPPFTAQAELHRRLRAHPRIEAEAWSPNVSSLSNTLSSRYGLQVDSKSHVHLYTYTSKGHPVRLAVEGLLPTARHIIW
jgi:hypothetical protein